MSRTHKIEVLWINGAFGSGKTTIAYELNRRIQDSYVYDPENVGYFLRKNAPKVILKNDFQDHAIWREMNFSLLQTISNDFPGIIIVPMTIVNPQYFDEIINKLRLNGIEVKYINTDNLTPEEIIELIARESNIEPQLDNRGIIKRKVDRIITQIKAKQM